MSVTGKSRLLYFYIFVSVALSLFVVRLPNVINVATVSLYLSAIAGYSGIMLMLWSFVLGTRSINSFLSDDYAQLIKTHELIGKYGMLLIFIHPILVMIDYGKSILFVLLPNYGSGFENAVTYGRTAFWIILIIWIYSALLRSKMSRRPWKYLHFATYIAIPFALLHVPDTGSNYATIIGAKIYFFVVVIGFVGFSLLRLRGALNINKSNYEIIDQTKVSTGVYLMRIKPTDNSDVIKPKPGQHIYLKFGWFSEDHPFSITHYDLSSGILTIGYKVYGPFTEKMSVMRTGDNLLITGPFGYFTDDITDKPVVYVAGGIGVTPFIWRIIDEPDKREQWLFYSNKTYENAPFINLLRSRMGDKLVAVCSRQSDPVDVNIERGRLCEEVFEKYLDDPKSFSYYICGPLEMIKDMKKDLIKLGVAPGSIHDESFNL